MISNEMMSQSMYVAPRGQTQSAAIGNILDDLHSSYTTRLQSQQFPLQSQFQQPQSEIFDESPLEKFIRTIEVSFCVTSPASRALFTNTKQVKARESMVLNQNKIWLDNEEECLHNMFDTKTLNIMIRDGNTYLEKKQLLSKFHCRDIIGFVKIFAQLPEVRDALVRASEQSSDKYGINKAFTDILDALQDYIKKSEEYKDIYCEQIADDIEKYLSRLIYQQVYPRLATARDIELKMRMQTLEWISNDHLEIKEQNRHDKQWALAAETLKTLDLQQNGLDKLNTLFQSTQIITDALKSINNETSSADVVFPIVVKVLLEAKLERLQSNINFIELFTNKSRMLSATGYCFTQLKSAIMWLESLDYTSLKISQPEYQRFIYEKEVKYNMIKMRQRRERQLIK